MSNIVIVITISFLVFNFLRLFFRVYKQEVKIKKVTISFALIVFFGLVFWIANEYIPSDFIGMLFLAFALVLLVKLFLNFFSLGLPKTSLGHTDMPTVSLLVPARNEDHVLKEMLANLLNLAYPKLEIIVLDDCSHDRTPQIISGFAKDGIRFVSGTAPPENWTGKNHAMQSLLSEASGEYVVFCDVDVNFEPDTLNKLIEIAVKNNSDYVSVIPTKRHFDLLPNLLPSLTDYWQLSLPKLLTSSNPVSGEFYLFRTKALIEKNGFEEVASLVSPEHKLAQRYDNSLTVLNTGLGLTSRKKAGSIIDTQIRNSYPTFAKEPSYVLVAGLLFVELAVLLWNHNIYALLALAVMMISYFVFVIRTNPSNLLFGLVQLPLLLFLQFVYLIVSMFKYETGTVSWKQRNVCYTSLETISKLPELD